MSRWTWQRSLLLLGVCALGLGNWEARAQDDEYLSEDESARSMGREEVDQDDPGARLKWEVEFTGPVSAAARKNEFKQINLHNAKKNAPGPKWVNIGPTDADYEQNGSFTGHFRDSGRARNFLFHPDYPDTVFFLTSGGGLWRTDNWSANSPKWTVLTDNTTTTGGGAVAFGRVPNTLYLGLGDPYDQLLIGGAVIKSKNGGVSWGAQVELGSTISVRDLKVDTSTNKDIVLVATENGLFRSADEGATFSAVPTFTGLSVWSIVRSSAGWLASAQPCPAPLGSRIGVICNTNLTIYLSTDKGATWAPISNAGGVFANNGRTTLAVAKPGEAVVYAYSSRIDESQLKDVYRSSDGGQTWVATLTNSTKIPTNPVTGASTQPNMNICGGQCWYNQSIGVDPADAARNTVWIGGNLGTASSTNGGATWTIRTWWLYNQNTIPYAHADHHALEFKTTGGAHDIVLGNDGGLNVSSDNGATFTSDKNRGLVSHLFYTIGGNEAFPNLVIGGLQDNGTRIRTGNGGTYDQSSGGDGLGTAYSTDNTNTVFASAASSTVPSLRANFSNNPPTEIQQFVTATSGFSDSTGSGFSTAIVQAPANLDPTGRVFFTFSNARVWKTTSGGLSTGTCSVVNQPGCGWKWIASALAPTNNVPTARRFRSSPFNLGVSPTDLNRIVVGGASGFIDVTTNGGTSWADINLVAAVPGFNGFISNVSWQDNQHIWVTGTELNPNAKRVLKGTIANPGDPWTGATWTVMQNGLPDLPVSRIYFDPRDATRNTIYAATHVGIYRTIDGGQLWAPFGNGLPTVRVNDIYMPPDGSILRLATYGRGIWELGQIELKSESLADDAGSCDNDGVLDNGETGTISIQLVNQGPNNVNKGSLTFSSSNPKVTFPNGNKINVPPMNKGATGAASIKVALAGAVGIENTTFTISIDAPELSIPPYTVERSYRLNYDEVPNGSATETFESASPNWSTSGYPTLRPNVLGWKRIEYTFDSHGAYGPDNNGQADGIKPDLEDEQILTSPVLSVGAGSLGVSFKHRYNYEANWDGGVVELSNDGGATWVDIGTGKYNSTTNNATSNPIGILRPVFTGRSGTASVGFPAAPTLWPAYSTITLNPVAGYSNQNVQIRFRSGADESTGITGWDIDDVAITGITNTPFTALVADPGVCN